MCGRSPNLRHERPCCHRCTAEASSCSFAVQASEAFHPQQRAVVPQRSAPSINGCASSLLRRYLRDDKKWSLYDDKTDNPQQKLNVLTAFLSPRLFLRPSPTASSSVPDKSRRCCRDARRHAFHRPHQTRVRPRGGRRLRPHACFFLALHVPQHNVRCVCAQRALPQSQSRAPADPSASPCTCATGWPRRKSGWTRNARRALQKRRQRRMQTLQLHRPARWQLDGVRGCAKEMARQRRHKRKRDNEQMVYGNENMRQLLWERAVLISWPLVRASCALPWRGGQPPPCR